MENNQSLPVPDDTVLLPKRKLSKKLLLSLGALALVVIVLPLAVFAARLTTNLNSKAYVPTTSKPFCVGVVENISYESVCNLSVPVPTPASDCISWFDGCNTCGVKNGVVGSCTRMACKGIPQTPRCLRTSTTPKIMNDQSGIERTVIKETSTRPEPTITTENVGYKNAIVKCVGGYTQQIDSNTLIGSTSDRGPSAAREAAIQDDRVKSGLVKNPIVSICISTKDIEVKAAAICAQHPVCSKPTPTPTPTLTPTPTPVQTCSAIQKHAFESPCKLFDGGPQTQEGSNIRIESTYTYINFTCADGYYEKFRFKSCTSTEALLKYAEDTCRNHLVIKPTFGNKCLVPINRPSVQGSPNILPSETPTKGQMGFDSIKFSCPDGFVSSYEPKTCTTSASLNTYANKVCLSHLVCAKPTPTSTPTPTCTPLPKCNVEEIQGKDGQYYCPTADLNPSVNYCQRISLSPTLTPKPTVTPTIIKPTISKNTPPSVTTSSLSTGVVGKTYSATITAKDMNPNDNLYMTISGLPFGIYQSNCQESFTTTPNGVVAPGAYISCTISGTAIRAGSYKLTAKVQDDKGLTSSKNLTLTITATPTSRQPL